MLINLTNHPSEKWDKFQKETSIRLFGDIVDIPFPVISPEADEEEVELTVKEYIDKIMKIPRVSPITVHVMGEMTFTVLIVERLKEKGIPCIASTTARTVTELADGKKISNFHFVRFRKYIC